MDTGWIIYSERDIKENKAYIDWFIEEAKLQNISLTLIMREELSIGIRNNEKIIYVKNKKVIDKPSFAIVRTIEPLLNLHLESNGVRVFNSSHVARICNDKALTHHFINKLNIPMVDTLFLKKENLPIEPPMTYPFVLKESGGRGGQQVYLIKSETDWKECQFKVSTSDIIIQATNVQLGKDIRVFVVGKEIVGAVLRESDTDFRSNFRLGGSAKLYELNDDEKELINKIIDYFDFGMVGIDFLLNIHDEFLFNEIEDVVGSRTLSSLSDINILRKYITHIQENN